METIKVIFVGSNQYIPVLNLKTPISTPVVISKELYETLKKDGYKMEVVSPVKTESKPAIAPVIETPVIEPVIETPVVEPIVEPIVEAPVVAEPKKIVKHVIKKKAE
jgi:hypothetical protein